jgi:glyoxylase-like metal-dependent hydrolase (beta-lactamase superfamily II)
MIPFENVKVLKPGAHGEVNGRSMASSSVTLIKGSKNIVVDSGGFANDGKQIIEALKKEGLKPEQIDVIIATHYHWDHVSNLNLFKNARLYKCYTFSSYVDLKDNTSELVDLKDGFKIIDGVEIILTPGHVEHHMSVIVKTNKGNVVIAGDAIGDKKWTDLTRFPEKRFVWDEKKYTESRKKIISIADFIIPGHGDIFEVEK